jgi:hypothetical protein
MTAEEEHELRQEQRRLQEQVRSPQELIKRQSQQTALLTAQVEDLQARLSKDSHNSHLPPSSDRFKRQPRSLHKKSGKKAGGQKGASGTDAAAGGDLCWLLSTSILKKARFNSRFIGTFHAK